MFDAPAAGANGWSPDHRDPQRMPLLESTSRSSRPTTLRTSNTQEGGDTANTEKMDMLKALIAGDDDHAVENWPHLACATFGKDRSPAILIASFRCKETTIDFLMENGAIWDGRDLEGRVPILVAATTGNASALSALLGEENNPHYEFTRSEDLRGTSSSPNVSPRSQEDREDQYMSQEGFKLPLPAVQGRTPLHEAALIGNSECLESLLQHGAEVNFKDGEDNTALHLAIREGNDPIDNPASTKNSYYQCIQLLLHRGAHLSAANKKSKTPLDHLLSCDKDYKEVEILCKYFDTKINEENDKICLDFRSLCPQEGGSQVDVILKMTENLNTEMQRKLFSHPLLRAFVILKWSSIRIFFYIYVSVFILYVFSLSVFVTLAHCDILYIFGTPWKLKTAERCTMISKGVMFFTSSLVLMNFLGRAYVLNNCYRFKFEMWRNLVGVALTFVILFGTVEPDSGRNVIPETTTDIAYSSPWTKSLDVLSTSPAQDTTETGYIPGGYPTDFDTQNAGFAEQAPAWVIYMTAVAVFLAWFELMLMIGRFPDRAAQALLFQPVMKNVFRILATYGCLIVGFAFGFFVLFRASDPDGFGDPWRALVKTMVMMIGEYDYSEIFGDDTSFAESKKQWTHSEMLTVSRFFFLLFIITASIALMNLMIALAVSDTQELLKISKEIQSIEFARSMVHWGYFIEGWSSYPVILPYIRRFLRKKFSIDTQELHHYTMIEQLPYGIKKELKETANNKPHLTTSQSPGQRKVDALLCAIMDLVEEDEVQQQLSALQREFVSMSS